MSCLKEWQGLPLNFGSDIHGYSKCSCFQPPLALLPLPCKLLRKLEKHLPSDMLSEICAWRSMYIYLRVLFLPCSTVLTHIMRRLVVAVQIHYHSAIVASSNHPPSTPTVGLELAEQDLTLILFKPCTSSCCIRTSWQFTSMHALISPLLCTLAHAVFL